MSEVIPKCFCEWGQQADPDCPFHGIDAWEAREAELWPEGSCGQLGLCRCAHDDEYPMPPAEDCRVHGRGFRGCTCVTYCGDNLACPRHGKDRTPARPSGCSCYLNPPVGEPEPDPECKFHFPQAGQLDDEHIPL